MTTAHEAVDAAATAPTSPVHLDAPESREEHGSSTRVEPWPTTHWYPDVPDDTTLADLVLEQASRTPDRVALVDGRREVTYADLAEEVRRLAAALAPWVTGPDTLVAVCLPRSARLVTTLLAVLHAGAAYLPVDPHYPADRVGVLLTDSDVPLVVADTSTRPLVESTGVRCPVVDVEVLATDAPVEPTGRRVARAHDLAYVIYTSGSTGRPKGVAIEHRQVTALLRWARRTFSPDELSGVLFSTSVCFDLSVFEIFTTLGAGGTLVVAGTVLDLPLLPHRDRVTLVNTVPSAMAVLVREGDLPVSVTTVVLAGEALSRRLADGVLENPGVTRLWNCYGPSEVTTYSTGVLVRRGGVDAPTIGNPLPEVTTHVLDPEGRPVAEGEVGELYQGGAQVARGYLGRPDLTSQRFLDEPGTAGGRMYRTGDLVRLRGDGELELHGRVDHQVKVRGFRVELGEVESVLSTHDGVAESVVVMRHDPRDTAHLVGFVVLRDGHRAVDEDGLRGWVASRLPEYMVPTRVVALDRMPLNPHGKADRGALPAVTLEAPAPRSARSTGGRTPEGELEKEVAATWCEVLGLDQVLADTPFLSAGGTSLAAASVLSRLARRTGVRLPLPTFFAGPTVSGVAAALAAAGARPGEPSPARTLDRVHDVHPPVSPVQSLFWLAEQLDGAESPLYVVPLQLRLSGAVDPERLRRALDEVLAGTPVLRTTLTQHGSALRATTHPPHAWPLEVHDLRGDLTAPDRSAALLAAAATAPLSIGRTPLVRAVLVLRDDAEHDLGLCLHHAVFDGWSTGLLLERLATAYDGGPLADAPQFAAVARSLLAEIESPAGDEARRYWAGRLAELDGDHSLPAYRVTARPERPRRGGRVELRLDPHLLQRAEHLATEHGASLFTLLVTLTAVLVHRQTARTVVGLTSAMSVRREPEAEQVVGPLLDTVPLVVDVAPDAGIVDLLRTNTRPLLEDLEHGWVGMAAAHRAAGRGGFPSTPGSNLLVAVQNHPVADAAGDGLRWTFVRELDNSRSKSDLSIFWEPAAVDGPLLSVEHALDLYDEDDARDVAERLVTLLESALADPHAPVSALEWVPQAQRREVQPGWRPAADLVSSSETVPGQVSRAARVHGDRVAVDCPVAGRVTYRELHAWACAVADRVVAAGVTPGQPVAVACPRGVAGVAALLGSWYAGAAYLPLDPGHPVARLADAVADSGCAVALTTPEVAQRLADPFAACTVLDVSALRPADAAVSSPSLPPRTPSPDDLAYLIYTSGSTGRPKGVRVGHAALASFLAGMDQLVPLAPGESVAGLTTVSFDIAGLEHWLTLRTGATLTVADDETARDGAALARWVASSGVTVLQATPSSWRMLLDGGWSGDPGLRALCGGEPMPVVLGERLLELTSEVWNVYGPTETTIWSTAHAVRPSDLEHTYVPVGHPLPNTLCAVLDPAGRPVPQGVVGEICLGGTSVADGYHGRAELTAERFVTATHLPGRPRMYRTGDLGRWRRDGVLECLGRNDSQIKLRGHRIELGEIEASLRALPQVSEAAVALREPDTARARLVGYVVPASGPDGVTPDGTDALAVALGRRLPAVMVPASWVVMDALPQTSNGKVDRTRLPDPGDGSRAAGTYEPPTGEMEELVAQIWVDVLGVERVGRLDDFFALGGHSLLVTQLMAEVRHRLELDVAVRTVFDNPRLTDLARVLEAELLADIQEGGL